MFNLNENKNDILMLNQKERFVMSGEHNKKGSYRYFDAHKHAKGKRMREK